MVNKLRNTQVFSELSPTIEILWILIRGQNRSLARRNLYLQSQKKDRFITEEHKIIIIKIITIKIILFLILIKTMKVWDRIYTVISTWIISKRKDMWVTIIMQKRNTWMEIRSTIISNRIKTKNTTITKSKIILLKDITITNITRIINSSKKITSKKKKKTTLSNPPKTLTPTLSTATTPTPI